MSNRTEDLLQTLIEEVRMIRQEIVKPVPQPITEENLTRVLGVGPENVWNK
jgi:hypothetical protein